MPFPERVKLGYYLGVDSIDYYFEGHRCFFPGIYNKKQGWEALLSVASFFSFMYHTLPFTLLWPRAWSLQLYQQCNRKSQLMACSAKKCQQKHPRSSSKTRRHFFHGVLREVGFVRVGSYGLTMIVIRSHTSGQKITNVLWLSLPEIMFESQESWFNCRFFRSRHKLSRLWTFPFFWVSFFVIACPLFFFIAIHASPPPR